MKITRTIKPNFKSLGPRFAQRLSIITGAIATMDVATIEQSLLNDGKVTLDVDGENIVLGIDDFILGYDAQPGYAVGVGKNVVVVLTAEITEDLKIEGVARELVHLIQGMRRATNLEFHKKINIRIDLIKKNMGEIQEAIKRHYDYIAKATLAMSVNYSEFNAIPGHVLLNRFFEIEDETAIIAIY